MKGKILAALLVLVAAPNLFGQTVTNLTAQIQDSQGVLWVNGPYTVTFVQTGAGTPYTKQGQSFTQQFSGTLNGSGQLSITVTDVNNIIPANSNWKICVTPAVSSPTTYCVTLPVTGASYSASLAINAIIQPPAVTGLSLATAYADSEVTPLDGNIYYRTDGIFRCHANGVWVNCGSNGSSGVTSVSGTANQIDVATGTTTPVISLDPAIIFPGTLKGVGATGGAPIAGGINATQYLLNGVALATGDSAGNFGILAHGAYCNGGTNDDTAGISATLTLAQAYVTANPGSGASVVFPAGVCVSAGMTGTSNITFSGQGQYTTVWRLASGSNSNLVTFAGTVQNPGIQDMTLDYNGANQTGTGAPIYFSATSPYVANFGFFQNLYITNPLTNGVYESVDTGGSFFNNVIVEYSTTKVAAQNVACFYIDGFDNVLENTGCQWSPGNGIDLEATNNQVIGGRVQEAGYNTTSGSGYYALKFGTNREQVVGFLLQNNYANGLYIAGYDSVATDMALQNNGRFQSTSSCAVTFASGAHSNKVSMVETGISDQSDLQAYALCGLSSATHNQVHGTTNSNNSGLINGTYANNDIHLVDASGTTIDQFINNVVATDFNGVPLQTGGSTSNFLNQGGSYTAPVFTGGQLSGITASIGGSPLTAACATGTATVTGAVANTGAWAASALTTSAPGATFSVTAQATATNTVTVSVCGTGTPTASTYAVSLGNPAQITGNGSSAVGAGAGWNSTTLGTQVKTDGSGNAIPDPAVTGPRTFVGPASAYSNATLSTTTVLTSPTIAAGVSIAFHCWGVYSFTNNNVAAVFGITASQTPQSIFYAPTAQISTSGSTSVAANTGVVATNSTNTHINTSAAATSTNYSWQLDGVIVWNASNPGTFTVGAATSNTGGSATINIPANSSYCTIEN